jgi:hypothetical protein
MNILVACEYSGIVRDAFENAGWNAWSCDLLPTESEQTKQANKHIQGDVIEIIKNVDMPRIMFATNSNIKEISDFDLLIGHPPCTYLSYAYTGKERYSNNRLQEKIHAYQFFLDLWNAPIQHICLENPMGYIHTGLLPCSQIVEPYYFGHDYKKKTCLWLKNLPKLQWTEENNLFGKGTMRKSTKIFLDTMSKKKRAGREHVLPAFSSKKERSKFHSGFAKTMAEQWTEFVTKNINI